MRKIFKLNDYDYWCGPDLESVKKAYMKEFGFKNEDDAFYHPHEIDIDHLKKMTIVNEDDGKECSGETYYRKAVKGRKQNEVFAFATFE